MYPKYIMNKYRKVKNPVLIIPMGVTWRFGCQASAKDTNRHKNKPKGYTLRLQQHQMHNDVANKLPAMSTQ